MRSALSLIATALVAAGVWRIGRMDVRGQWLMLAAQALWLAYAVAVEAWGLAAGAQLNPPMIRRDRPKRVCRAWAGIKENGPKL